MNYTAFRDTFHHYRIFSVNDIKKSFADFDSRRLVEWQEKGYIKKVINRWYLFSDTAVDDNMRFWVANRIYKPSYVSLESALSYYDLIPEAVYATTSVTSKKTVSFDPFLGTFSYRHVKPSLFFGYQVVDWEGFPIKLAEKEKVMLDYFYLNPAIVTNEALDGLRLNVSDLKDHLDVAKLNEYLTLFGSKALEKRVNLLLKYLELC